MTSGSPVRVVKVSSSSLRLPSLVTSVAEERQLQQDDADTVRQSILDKLTPKIYGRNSQVCFKKRYKKEEMRGGKKTGDPDTM